MTVLFPLGMPIEKEEDALQIVVFYKTRWTAQVVRWIAKSGGFLGRKNDHNPCVTVIWRVWARFTEIVDDYLLFASPKLVGNS